MKATESSKKKYQKHFEYSYIDPNSAQIISNMLKDVSYQFNLKNIKQIPKFTPSRNLGFTSPFMQKIVIIIIIIII
jgi:hypothetical protein